MRCAFWVFVLAAACRPSAAARTDGGSACRLIEQGYGPAGKVPVRAEVVVAGLEVPWGLAFPSKDEMLVTERPGRIRLVQAGKLVEAPVATLPIPPSGEGGLLGIALHPDFATTGLFYVYVTSPSEHATNRIERWKLAADHRSASRDRVVFDRIPAERYHDGGRLRLGPDGMIWAGTGDAGKSQSAQDPASPSGKILRLTPDGSVPADNPLPGNAAFVLGLRNVEAFDFRDAKTLLIADHGPSGELGRTGHDEIDLGGPGDNFGWPVIYGCSAKEGLVTPLLTWTRAVPPGGGSFYTGTSIAEWKGSFLVGTLGSKHLHRVVLDPQDPRGPRAKVAEHEVYFQNVYGRLRDVVMGPDGELYVTTSNCDGRGDCPPERDKILRILRDSG
jgi:aldose sugar dehydrogenase